MRIFLLASAFIAILFSGNLMAQPNTIPAPIKTSTYKYSPDLTEEQLYDIDRLHYMPKEDWSRFSQDPRFDADRVSALLTTWKEQNKPHGQLKTLTQSIDCYWIEPTSAYNNPNTIQWPGSPGNSTDNYSAVINLPFNFNYFGQNYNQVVLTTKGTIVLGSSGYIDYTPSAFPTPLSSETTDQHDHICGFWSDWDFAASGDLYYLVTSEALYVNYVDVGYWPNQGEKTNTLQMIICADGSEVIGNGNNVQFVYKDMQFANSQISGAVGGFNAASNLAIVGCDRVSGNAGYTFGRFNLDNTNYNGPFGVAANQQDGVNWLDGRVIEFNTSITNINANIAPVPVKEACDTIYLCQGETFNFNLAFTAPESTQTATITTTQSQTGFTSTNQVLTNASQFQTATFVAGPNNIGNNIVNVTATDNGTPALSTTVTYVFVVSQDVAAPLSISGPTSLCAGATSTLTATAGFDSYSWSNGGTGPTNEVSQSGPITVFAESNGCTSTATITIDVTPYFIPQLEGGNEPIILCPGQTTELCVLGDYVSYEWYIYPGYDGEFTPTTALDEPCVEVTGNVNGNYGILVTDEAGCQGLNIKLVSIIQSFIDPANDNNSGAYCDGFESVNFTGGYSNPAIGNLIIYGLSTNQNGWQGSYINVNVFPDGEGPPVTTFITTFNTFTIFSNIEIGVGDSITIDYIANGNNFPGNSIWILNCGSQIPTILGPPLTSGQIWSGLSGCTSQPLSGNWTVTGPSGWNLTTTTEYNTTFTPTQYGLYDVCFNDPACSIDHCYQLEFTLPPTIQLNPGQQVLLCGNETINTAATITDVGGTGTISWSGTGANPASNSLSAVYGPYSTYVNTNAVATITNGCGIASDSFAIAYQPQVPQPSLDDQVLCNAGSAILDPIASNQDNSNLVYSWTPGNQTTSTITVNSPGTYSVVVSNLCDTSDPESAIVGLVPAATVTNSPPLNIFECDETSLPLSVSYQNPMMYTVSWNSGEATNSIIVDEDGQYCYTITDNLGCNTNVTGCSTVNFASEPSLNPSSTTDPILCPNECEELNLFASGESLSYGWITSCNNFVISNSGQSYNFCSNSVPNSCVGAPITITGTASNGCGSVSNSWTLVPDVCSLKIPNVFTPNDDSVNENFEIIGLDNYEDVSFKVFNRWGNEVFSDSNYRNSWNGSDLESGTYFYILELPFGIQKVYKGSLTILRN